VIRQPVSVVSQCGAGAWLNGLASGYQRRLTGSGSASEACSRRCAIQIHLLYYTSLYRRFTRHTSVWEGIIILCRFFSVRLQISRRRSQRSALNFARWYTSIQGRSFFSFVGGDQGIPKRESLGLNFGHLTPNISKTVSRSVTCQL